MPGVSEFPAPGEAVGLIQKHAQEFEDLVIKVPENLATRRGVVGGDWSVSDLVGHIETWEEAALRTIESWPKDPDNPQWQAIDDFNAKHVESKRARSWQENWSSYQDTHKRLIDAVASIPDKEWNSVMEGAEDTRTLGQRVAGNLAAPKMPFGHVTAHLDDLRAAIAGLRDS